MALVAKYLISLMARGALFLKETPCSFTRKLLAFPSIREILNYLLCFLVLFFPSSFFLRFDNSVWVIETTYSLVHVDGVLAGNHVRNGGALSRLL